MTSPAGSLYERAKTIGPRVGTREHHEDKMYNSVLAMLVKSGERPAVIADKLKISEREVRNRVTLDEVGLVHCTPEDFRYTAEYIEETLHKQINPQNLAAAPLLRIKGLLFKLADEYEKSQEAQRLMIQRKEREDAERDSA
jgi:phosphotransacetylase